MVYGIRLLQILRAHPEIESHLVCSKAAERTIAEETDWAVKDVKAMASVVHPVTDIGASIASGSFRTEGMVIIPCSIHTVGAVAHCISDTLLTRAADVCLVPSRTESFGLVALEAAASGTPVVASAVGGLRALVDDGITGFLVEDRSVEGYAAPVAQLLADHELRSWIGHNASVRSDRYSWSIGAARLRRLYADVAARALVQCS